MDLQNARITSVAGDRGYDSTAKKVNGCKSHILIDTLGLFLIGVVTGADISENQGARLLLSHLRGHGKKLQKIWVDFEYKLGLFTWVVFITVTY